MAGSHKVHQLKAETPMCLSDTSSDILRHVFRAPPSPEKSDLKINIVNVILLLLTSGMVHEIRVWNGGGGEVPSSQSAPSPTGGPLEDVQQLDIPLTS